jgi:predicted RNase H-like nuclease
MSRAIGPLVRRLLDEQAAEDAICRRIRRRGGGISDLLDSLVQTNLQATAASRKANRR